MVSTASLANELREHGFNNVLRWPRGVDSALFRPDRARDLGLKRPIFLTVGRVAGRKGWTHFCPLTSRERRWWSATVRRVRPLSRVTLTPFSWEPGAGRSLLPSMRAPTSSCFQAATDTFGLVLLEALASGVPVAGFPVAATQDVVGSAPVAVLDSDLRSACLGALAIPRHLCRQYAETVTWEASARSFLGNLVSFRHSAAVPLAAAASGRPGWGSQAPGLWERTPR